MAKGRDPPQAWMNGDRQLTRFYTKYEISVRCGIQRGARRAALKPQLTTALQTPPDHNGVGAAHEGVKGHRLFEEDPRAKQKVLISLKLGDTSIQVRLNGFCVILTFYLQPDISQSKLNFTSNNFQTLYQEIAIKSCVYY